MLIFEAGKVIRGRFVSHSSPYFLSTTSIKLLLPLLLPLITHHSPNHHLLFKTLFKIFALLIAKDGGIGPCEVLATCAYKVPNST